MERKIIKYCLFICLGFSFTINGKCQTVIATETFGTGSAAGTLANGFVGDMGTWTVTNTGVNGASGNNWYVSGEECGNAVGTCGTACPGGDNSLHVSAIGGFCAVPDCGAAYDATNANNITNQRAESPTVDCLGLGNITLNFNYIAAQGDDGFWVEYSLDNGATWLTFTGGNLAESGCCCLIPGWCTNPTDPTPCSDAFSAQGYWTAASLNFPAGADNNPTVKFAFHWSNDGNGLGTDPSVAIDDITVTHDIILPVTLTSFTGYSDGPITSLKWTTASEQNCDYFDIEHSVDGKFYQKIQTVKSNGNSSTQQEYFSQHQTKSELNYYRLKQVDRNGKYSYSEPIVVETDLSGIQLFFNENSLTVMGLEGKKGKAKIIDPSGRTVLEPQNFSMSDSEIEISSGQLNSGTYFVIVECNSERKTFKVIL